MFSCIALFGMNNGDTSKDTAEIYMHMYDCNQFGIIYMNKLMGVYAYE